MHGVVACAFLKKHEQTKGFDWECQLEILEAEVREGKANQNKRLYQALYKMINIELNSEQINIILPSKYLAPPYN